MIENLRKVDSLKKKHKYYSLIHQTTQKWKENYYETNK